MPLTSGGNEYNASIACRIAWYFGKDTNPDYAGITLPWNTQQFSEWFLFISRDSGVSSVEQSVTNCIELYLPEDHYKARMVADGLAHEWQHICFYSRPSTARFIGADGVDLFKPNSEYLSQCAEWKAGWHKLPFSSDVPFDRALVNNDWYPLCDNVVEGQTNGNKHLTWSLFAPYLVEHCRLGSLPQQELLYKWRANPVIGNPAFTRWDLWALANDYGLLGSQDFNGFFEQDCSTGAARVKRMFQHYALSLFVNSDEVAGLPEEAALWCNGDKPWEVEGYLRDWDGACKADAHALLLYHTVGEGTEQNPDSTTSQYVYPKNIFDPSDPEHAECAGCVTSLL